MIARKGLPDRGDAAWIARATTSLPVPDSPVRRTVVSVFATFDTRSSTSRQLFDFPMIFLAPPIDASCSVERRDATFEPGRLLARLRRDPRLLGDLLVREDERDLVGDPARDVRVLLPEASDGPREEVQAADDVALEPNRARAGGNGSRPAS